MSTVPQASSANPMLKKSGFEVSFHLTAPLFAMILPLASATDAWQVSPFLSSSRVMVYQRSVRTLPALPLRVSGVSLSVTVCQSNSSVTGLV